MRASAKAAAQRPPFFSANRPRPARPGRAALAALALALGLDLALVAPAGAEVIDRVAAAVGGEAIPQSEVEENWAALQAAPGAPPDVAGTVTRADVLSRMVDVRVQLQKAREAGMEAKSEDVEEALTHIMADNGVHSLAELGDALAREGRTLEDLRRDVRDQITVLRLVQREVTAKLRPTPEELRAYYDAHPERFATGRSVHVRQIVFVTAGLSDDEAEKVVRGMAALRSELTGRDAFRKAEERLSGTPGVVVGDAGHLAQDELRPDLARVLFALEPGQVSPPLALPNGVAVFLVDSRDPGVPMPYDQALPDVRRAVTEQESQARGAEWLARLKRTSYIEIKGDRPAGVDEAPEAVSAAPAPPAPAPPRAGPTARRPKGAPPGRR